MPDAQIDWKVPKNGFVLVGAKLAQGPEHCNIIGSAVRELEVFWGWCRVGKPKINPGRARILK